MWVLPMRTASIVIAGTVVVGGCDDGPTESREPPLRPYAISILEGDRQVGEAGSALGLRLAVRVEDARNTPVAGFSVRWSAPAGGSVSASVTRTDSDGVARVALVLPENADEHRTAAWLDDPNTSSIWFISIAQVHGAFRLMETPERSGQGQSDTVLARLAPYRVLAVDYKGLPVHGVPVVWSLGGDGGTLSALFAHTDANGIAEVVHTLGSRAAFELVRASVQGLIGSPVNFLTPVSGGSATALAVLRGDGQAGLVGATLEPYTITTVDAYGNPSSRNGIEWSVTSGGGLITPITTLSARHTLGPLPGMQTVTARLLGSLPNATNPAVTFTSLAANAIVSVGSSYGFYYYYDPFFHPADIAVPRGSVVAWVWMVSPTKHNVTFEDNPDQPISSPTLSAGSFLRTFDMAPTTIRYRCTLHSPNFESGEVGKVIVQ